MMLSKFPVTTDRGEYRVTIRNSIVFDRAYVTRVYVARKRSFPLFRYKRIAFYLDERKRWRSDLIGLAKLSVINAEDKLDTEFKQRHNDAQAIEAFRNWDGNMSKEGSR